MPTEEDDKELVHERMCLILCPCVGIILEPVGILREECPRTEVGGGLDTCVHECKLVRQLHTYRDHSGRAVSHERLVQVLDLPQNRADGNYNDEVGEPADV